MALTGLDIFKLLPKTNCKKCGMPTCLAFAMALAQKRAKLDDCPDVSQEAKDKLAAAAAPPMQKVVFGTGDGLTANKLIMLPRAHLKSHMVATWCAWIVTRHPEVTILYLSATADLASKISIILSIAPKADSS